MTHKATISSHTIVALFIALWAVVFFTAERQFISTDWVAAQALSLPAVLLYLFLLYRRRRAVLFTSFYQTFYWAGILSSALAISFGSEMIEIRQTGTANGTYWIALLFFVTGMETTVAGYRVASWQTTGIDAVRLSRGINRMLISAAVIPTLALAAFVLVVYRGPILTGVDRVSFFREMPQYVAQLPNLATQSFFFAAFYFLQRRQNGKPMVLAWLAVLGYLAAGYFVLGQKFSLYIIFVSTWLFIVPGIFPQVRLNKRYVLVGLLCAILVGGLVAITYLGEGRGVSFILTRLALQSQLLWSVLNEEGAITFIGQGGCFWGCEGFANGQHYIMQRYMPGALYDHYLATGSILSGYNPALPLLAFGFFGALLLYASAAFVMGFIQQKAVSAFRSDQMLFGFFLFKLHFGISLFVAMATLDALRGIAAMFVLVVLYIFASIILTLPKRKIAS